MTWRILVSAPYLIPALPRYEEMFRRHGLEIVVAEVRERLSEAELLRWLEGIDGIICGDDRLTARVLEAFPRLKVIAKWGTGIDAIDRDAAARLGIPVCNTPGAFTQPVADTALGYILLCGRQLAWMDRDLRVGRWEKRSTRALHECTLGIIGVGAIGRAVAMRAAAFGMPLLGHDPKPVPPDVLAATGLRMVGKEELLRQADFVSLHCDLNSTSFHLISDRELALMQPTAYLINTSRGPVVDEPALVRALAERRIAGAALDVFEEEPLPAESPLRTFDNCFLAPHNANSSPAAAQRVHEHTIRQLVDALRAASPSRPVGARVTS